jgi:integrase
VSFTDAMMPGHKAIVSATGHISFYHQWTHWSEGKKVDKIATFPGITPETSRQIVMERSVLIARRIDPNTPPQEEMPKIRDFIEDEFIPFAQKKYKKFATVQSQLNCWILNYFSAERDKPLDRIERKDAVKFIEWAAENGSEVTANRVLALLSTIMNRAIDLGLLERNPCLRVRKFPEPESRDRVASEEEFQRLVRTLRRRIAHPHVKILYLLTLLSLRLSEVLTMRWSLIDLEKAQYTIPKPKNGRRRVIALNPLALELLEEMRQQRDPSVDWVFPSNSRSGHVTDIKRMAKSVFAEAEVYDFRIHDIRRSAASALLNDYGASLASVREILGHSDLRSTMVYARLSAKSMAKTSRLLAEKVQGVCDD